jgi:hypothetical protein
MKVLPRHFTALFRHLECTSVIVSAWPLKKSRPYLNLRIITLFTTLDPVIYCNVVTSKPVLCVRECGLDAWHTDDLNGADLVTSVTNFVTPAKKLLGSLCPGYSHQWRKITAFGSQTEKNAALVYSLLHRDKGDADQSIKNRVLITLSVVFQRISNTGFRDTLFRSGRKVRK